MNARLLSAGLRVGRPRSGRLPGRTRISNSDGPPWARSAATCSGRLARSLVEAAYR